MNRQEQITKAAKAYVKDITTDIPATLQVMFIKGAEWADEHPKDGLVSIDKVCEYLANHIDKGLVIYNNNTWLKRDEFIEKLKKEINK